MKASESKGRPRSDSEAEDLLTAWAAIDQQQAAASADNLLRSGSAGLLRSSTSLNRIPSAGSHGRRDSSSDFLAGLQGAVAIGASPKLPPISATDVYIEEEDDFLIGDAQDDAPPIAVHKLNEANLALSSNEEIILPTYDRKNLTAGILHVGVGNFHRAHQATYLDDLFHLDFEGNKEWGLVGGGIMHFDAAKRDLLQSQDWLSMVVARDGETSHAKVIGSMIDFLPVDADGASLLEGMISPNIKIVSLTVTEGGYFLNDGQFDPKHPQIQHDITNPDAPKTVFGMIIKALKIRREAGDGAFTCLSCDNIPHNGDVLQSALLGLAAEIDGDFAKWMKTNVACPNSMVDRITPATTDEQRLYVKSELGFEDAAPVFCEPYRQWVLEDNFPLGRPKLELLDNVTFIDDVTAWEFMKIRVLNGGHASLCYPSALLGVPFVHEAIWHPLIGPFLDALERNEILPTVTPPPDMSLEGYLDLIFRRFSNPTINDTITRICFGGASNQPKFTIPVAIDNLKAGRGVDGIALVSALWCRYCQGTTEAGDRISPNDPQWDRLQDVARQAASDPSVWLDSLHDVYGDVGQNQVFAASFAKALTRIQDDGVEAAMTEYLEAYQ